MNAKIRFTHLSRLLFLGYVLYTQVFNYLLFYNPILDYGLLFAALLTQLAEDRFYLRGKTYLWLLAFATVSFIISFFVAVDLSLATKYVTVFLKYVVLVYLIHRYSTMDNNVRFSTIAFVFLALVMAATNLLFAGTGDRMTFSDSLNVNAVGMVCMFGIAYILFLLIRMKKKPLLVLFVLGILLLLAFIVVKTVSKKAIIAAAVLVAFWLLFCYQRAFGKQNVIVRVFLFAALLAGLYLAFRWFARAEASSLEYLQYRFDRLDLNDGGSTKERADLIRIGFDVFLEHPLIGVGFNNFRYYNEYHTYAHCFYAELLACTGLLGGILFGVPLVRTLVSYIRSLLQQKKQPSVEKTETIFMFALFVVVLVLSWTQIFFYEQPLMYAFGVLTAYIELQQGSGAAAQAGMPLPSRT